MTVERSPRTSLICRSRLCLRQPPQQAQAHRETRLLRGSPGKNPKVCPGGQRSLGGSSSHTLSPTNMAMQTQAGTQTHTETGAQ